MRWPLVKRKGFGFHPRWTEHHGGKDLDCLKSIRLVGAPDPATITGRAQGCIGRNEVNMDVFVPEGLMGVRIIICIMVLPLDLDDIRKIPMLSAKMHT